MRPIFLCGFMGCGKSTVGKILAKKMGCQCVDLDKYIEDTAGMSIPEIFDKYGEEHFRKLETEALAAYLRSDNDRRITAAYCIVRVSKI